MAFTSAQPVVKLLVTPRLYDGRRGRSFYMNFNTRYFNQMLYVVYVNGIDETDDNDEFWLGSLDERIDRAIHDALVATLTVRDIFTNIDVLIIKNTENDESIYFHTTSLTIDQYEEPYTCDLNMYVMLITRDKLPQFIMGYDFMPPGSFLYIGNVVLIIMTEAHSRPQYCREVFKFNRLSFTQSGGVLQFRDMTYPRSLLWVDMITAFKENRCNVPFNMLRTWFSNQPMITGDGIPLNIPAAQ